MDQKVTLDTFAPPDWAGVMRELVDLPADTLAAAFCRAIAAVERARKHGIPWSALVRDLESREMNSDARVFLRSLVKAAYSEKRGA